MENNEVSLLSHQKQFVLEFFTQENDGTLDPHLELSLTGRPLIEDEKNAQSIIEFLRKNDFIEEDKNPLHKRPQYKISILGVGLLQKGGFIQQEANELEIEKRFKNEPKLRFRYFIGGILLGAFFSYLGILIDKSLPNKQEGKEQVLQLQVVLTRLDCDTTLVMKKDTSTIK